jgi:hypothetical protein
MNTIDWIERTKRRHRQCLTRQSNGAAALAVSVPAGVERNWTRRFQDPDVMLEGELAKLENCLAVRSDLVPVVSANFAAAVAVSLFDGWHWFPRAGSRPVRSGPLGPNACAASAPPRTSWNGSRARAA